MGSNTNDNLKFWRQKLREFQRSGLSRRVFCEQNGIKKSRLDYWFARLGKQNKVTGLVEVKPALPPTPLGLLEVMIAGRYRIEVHGAVDRTLFCEVVKALESLA
jgi:hypothetical protein